MKIEDEIYNLKKRILEYRAEFYEKSHPAIKADINSVEISISLTEIFINYRDLTADEIYWFKGNRFIQETFQNEWKDIAEQYKKISDYVQNEKPIRKRFS